MRELGLGGCQAQVRPDPRPELRARVEVLDVLRRLRDAVEDQLDPALVGGQETRLLVGELLVERLTGDAGAIDDVGDAHVGIAELGHGRGHCAQQPVAVGPGHLVARQLAATTGQAACRFQLRQCAH